MGSVTARARFEIPHDQLAGFCRRKGVRKLSLFGSVLTDRFTDSSDVDVLVEFSPGQRAGYLYMAAMERELSAMFGSRRIDLRTPRELSPWFREEVIAASLIQYEATAV